LDESEAYFDLTTVLEKGFFAAKKMYGITFKERKICQSITDDVWLTKCLITTENQWQSTT
jgi:Zn-dependent oligopeptidase